MPTTRSRYAVLITLILLTLSLTPHPSHAQTDPACGTLAPRLVVGGRARVVTEAGQTLRLRTAPNLASGTSARLAPGDTLIVLQEPVCADGLRWWQLRTASGLPGWTAEGRGAVYLLAPVAGPTITPTAPPTTTPTPSPTITPTLPASPTPSASPTRFPTVTPSPTLDALCWTAPLPRLRAGNSATVARDIEGLRLRSLPAVGAGEEGILRPGTPFTVKDGPVCNMGYYWYRVTLGSGTIGWLAEGAGTNYWAVPAQDTLPLTADQLCTAWTDAAGLHIQRGRTTVDIPTLPADTLHFAPNGRFLAALNLTPEQAITMTDLATGETLQTLPLADLGADTIVESFAGWLPDSRAILLNGTDSSGQPAIWQITVHGEVSQLTGWHVAPHPLTAPHNLPYVTLIQPETWAVAVFDANAGRIIQEYRPATEPEGTARATYIQWMADGQLYATFRATPDGGPSTIQTAVRLNPASEGVTPLALSQPFSQIVWAPAGTPVVYALTSGAVFSAPDLTAPGIMLSTLSVGSRATTRLSLSPDGETVLLHNGAEATLLSQANVAPDPVSIPESQRLIDAEWLAAESLLLTTHPATTPDDTALWLYDTQTGATTELLAPAGTTAHAVSPSGCWFPEE